MDAFDLIQKACFVLVCGYVVLRTANRLMDDCYAIECSCGWEKTLPFRFLMDLAHWFHTLWTHEGRLGECRRCGKVFGSIWTFRVHLRWFCPKRGHAIGLDEAQRGQPQDYPRERVPQHPPAVFSAPTRDPRQHPPKHPS